MYKDFVLMNGSMSLHGYEWAAEEPKALVCLVHGIGEHAGRYDHIGDYFAKRGIAMCAIDLRGHGQTEGKRGHAAPRALVLSDIDHLVDRAAEHYPGVPVYLYGHSMGGNIVLDYVRHGGRNSSLAGYIVTAPWLVLAKSPSPVLVGVLSVIASVWPDMLINTGLQASNISRLDTEVKKYVNDPLIHHKISILTALDGMRAAKEILSSTDALKKPMLLMHGTQDRICSIEGSRRIGGSKEDHCIYMEWDGLYHEIHNEKNGEMVLNTIVDWLEKQS